MTTINPEDIPAGEWVLWRKAYSKENLPKEYYNVAITFEELRAQDNFHTLKKVSGNMMRP